MQAAPIDSRPACSLDVSHERLTLKTRVSPMKGYLSVQQVAAKLNGAVSVKTIYAMIKRGKLRVNRAFGKILIEEDSLEELFAPPAPVAPLALTEPAPRPKARAKLRQPLPPKGFVLW